MKVEKTAEDVQEILKVVPVQEAGEVTDAVASEKTPHEENTDKNGQT